MWSVQEVPQPYRTDPNAQAEGSALLNSCRKFVSIQ